MAEFELVSPPHAERAAYRRLDVALARMAGRLSAALDAVGDEDGARFLRSLPVPAGPEPPDGGCLDLPSAGWQPADRLVAGFALSPADRDMLVLALLGHHHEGVAAVLNGLHPQRLPWPTVGLAGWLAELGLLAGTPSRGALRDQLASSPLLRAGALSVEGTGPFHDRTLRPAPLLWEALTGFDGWPAGLARDPRPTPAWGLAGWFASPGARAARTAIERQAPVTVLATGERPGPLAGRLAALVEVAGRVPVVLRAESLNGPVAAAALLLALARDVVPVIWTAGEPAGELDLGIPQLACAEPSVPLLVAMRGHAVSTWPRQRIIVPGSPLGEQDRRAALEAALPELGALPHPLGPASVEPGDIAMAAADVRLRAALLRTPLSQEQLRREVADAIDSRTVDAVPAGAVLVHPSAGWDALVLPEGRSRQLREAVDRMRARPVVLDGWGFLHGRPGAHGLRLLFCGPPGTGKTLAAEVVAAELGSDLLIVDLSRLVSKWLGETEKNLAAVFDAAERGGAAVLFDEADALFGRRTEVGDARDRYANLETAYLLSRLERFDGVAILATNLRQNLDTAFARRIEFIVPFDLPDEAERLALWQRHIPDAAPVDSTVDLAELAALYELPGALIRNAATAAAFLAAAENDLAAAESDVASLSAVVPGPAAIGVSHLVHAIRREYVKAGQAFPGPPPGSPADASIRKGSPRWLRP